MTNSDHGPLAVSQSADVVDPAVDTMQKIYCISVLGRFVGRWPLDRSFGRSGVGCLLVYLSSC